MAQPANEDTPLNFQDAPTMPMLTYMPTQSGGEIKIIEEIGAKYVPLGTLLLKDDTGAKTDEIVAAHPQLPGLITRSILSTWVQGGGREPVAWATLIDVLKRVGLKKLARDIEKQAEHVHIPPSPAENEPSARAQPPAAPGSAASPMPRGSQQSVGPAPNAGQVQEQQGRGSVDESDLIRSSDEVKKKIRALKKGFRGLKTTIIECLEKHKVLVKKVADVLTQLSPDDDEHHRMFLEGHIEHLNKATDHSELFVTMNFHWNYLDPSLLDHMVNELELDDVKEEMEAYEEDLQKFRKNTPLALFCETQKKKKRKLPQDFNEVVAEFNTTSDEDVTLEDVEQFRQEYASHYSVHEFAMMLAQVRFGSFIITLFIPESIVEKLKESDNVPREIMKKYSVTKLTVAGTVIYPYHREEEDDPIDVQSSNDPACSRSESEVTASSSEESEQSVIPHSEGASAPETNAPSKDTATKQAQGRVGGEGHIPSPTPKQESSDTVGVSATDSSTDVTFSLTPAGTVVSHSLSKTSTQEQPTSIQPIDTTPVSRLEETTPVPRSKDTPTFFSRETTWKSFEEEQTPVSHSKLAISAPISTGTTLPPSSPPTVMELLPGARYLLKVAKDKCDVASVTSYVAGQLQKRGMQCDVEGRLIVVSVADSGILLAQAEKLKWMKPLKGSDEEVAYFTVARKAEFEPSDGEKLFSSAECSLLLYHCLEDTPYTASAIQRVHRCEVEEGKGFLSALQLSKPPILKKAYPLHEEVECRSLMTMLRWSVLPGIRLNVQHIRNYFGEEVGFYFGWMSFYLRFICLPLVVGLAMYVLQRRGVTVNTDPYLPFFSIFIWGVLFTVGWQRQSNTLSFLWNTYTLSPADKVRPEFHGNTIIDPVTRQPMLHYLSWKRRLWYLVSVAAMLSLGVIVMILSLNLNGYVKNKESLIYRGDLARYAQPGGLFAGDSPYFLWLVPTLGHSVCVSFINRLYSRVAERCTDWENHRTVHGWHSSLVVKRVLFRCFNCFMPLFYIVIYRLDVEILQAEMFRFFLGVDIRLVVIPMSKQFLIRCKQFLVGRVGKRLGKAGIVPDTDLAEYDQFDDYLEMVILFWYITLFASAFPLGAAVTFLFLYVKVRSDLFKLITAYRRPFPRRVRDIGVWFEVMQGMVVVAALTNCLILGFFSEQLVQGPNAGGCDRYVVVFGCLLVAVLWLRYTIHPIPKTVRVAIARRKFLLSQRSQQRGVGETVNKQKED